MAIRVPGVRGTGKPFILSVFLCSRAPLIDKHGHVFGRFCRGCTVECNEDRASLGNAYIAVDWDPTALHLRYQTSQERVSAIKKKVISVRDKEAIMPLLWKVF